MKNRIALSLFATIVVAALTVSAPVEAVNDFFANNDIFFYNQNDTTTIDCGDSSGVSVSSLVGTNNREKIWNYLIANGLSAVQAAGLMGNIQAESSYSPTRHEGGIASEFSNGGWGIVQWTNYRNEPGGRRDIAVSKFREANASVLDKYYNANYGTAEKLDQNGYVPIDYSSGELMPIADNDALLLIELNYMLQEAQNTKVQRLDKMPANISTSVIKGKTEWEAIKMQTSVKNASDIWLWSYEYPANISEASATRAGFGDAIYAAYSTSDTEASGMTSSDCTPAGEFSSDKIAVATNILANNNITLNSGPASPREQIEAIANKTSTGNTTSGAINIYILNMIAALGKSHTITVTSINRYGQPDAGSSHPSGSAFDICTIDGITFLGQNEEWDENEQAAARLTLSIVTPYLLEANKASRTNGSANISRLGQSKGDSTQVNCGASKSTVMPSNLSGKVVTFPDTCHHIHIGVAVEADADLEGF